MTHIYFVRHSKVTYIPDEEKRTLSDDGRVGLRGIEDFFSPLHIDRVYSSPYKRALETISGIVDAKGLEVNILDDLKERITGLAHIEDFDAYTRAQWEDLNFKLEAGESIKDVQARATKTLQLIIGECQGKNVLIGTHGTFLASVIHYYDNTFGYEGWKSLNMPDIVHFQFDGDKLESISFPYGLRGFIEATEADALVNIKTLMVYKDYQPVFSFAKKPYSLDDKHLLYSITKSITGIAVGIAVDKGFLNLSDKIISFFPEETVNLPSENLKAVTIENLLTMSSGISENTYDQLYEKSDWVRAFLEQDFDREPGTYYLYSTHGSHMLSAIIQKVTGMTLHEFVKVHLFTPLEIFDSEWEMTHDGITAGGMGLSLASESVCKIGNLLLSKGYYKGLQLVSEWYINLATDAQIYKVSAADTDPTSYRGTHYGYQIHIGVDGTYRFDGAFGQVCMIIPREKMVIMVTSQYSSLDNLLGYLHHYLIPPYNQIRPIFPSDNNDTTYLVDNLSYVKNWCVGNSGQELDGSLVFVVGGQFNGIGTISIEKNHTWIEVKTGYLHGGISRLEFDLTHPVEGIAYYVKDITWVDQPYISYAGWSADGNLLLTVYFLETPYVATYTVQVGDGKVTLDYAINKSFVHKNFVWEGRLV